VLDGVDGFAGGLLGEVAVDVGRGGQGGVAQGLGDHGERHAGGDGEGGGQVPQIVNAHPGDTRFVGQVPEPVQNGAGPQWPAVGSAEDQSSGGLAWVVVSGGAGAGAVVEGGGDAG
jgi:hypothetical protein